MAAHKRSCAGLAPGWAGLQTALLALALAALLAPASLGVAASHARVEAARGNASSVGRSFFGTPISAWYFVMRTDPGWLRRRPYCGFSRTPQQSETIVTCDKLGAPLFSLFNLVSPSGQLPAVTGQELLLVSRAAGICGTVQEQGADDGSGVTVTRTGVTCKGSYEQPTTYSVLPPDLTPGVPIDLTTSNIFYLLENDKFCAVAATANSKSSLVCDLNTTTGAMRFALEPAAFPFASLSSVASQARCSVKSMLEPPPHPIKCVDNPSADPLIPTTQPLDPSAAAASNQPHTTPRIPPRTATRAAPRRALAAAVRGGVVNGGSGTKLLQGAALAPAASPALSGKHPVLRDDDPTYSLTFLLQKPGTPLASGSVVGIVTYSPGLMGFPLQQCCALPDSPHVVDCAVATGDPVASECWFTLTKVNTSDGDLIQDGDLIMLASTAYARFCSVTVDGTLLCVSASSSNASRNLFKFQATLPAA